MNDVNNFSSSSLKCSSFMLKLIGPFFPRHYLRVKY